MKVLWLPLLFDCLYLLLWLPAAASLAIMKDIDSMISQQPLFDLDGIQAVPCNVQVSEEGHTATIQEDADGEVCIEEWKLCTAARRVVSKALCVWKYGIVPCD